MAMDRMPDPKKPIIELTPRVRAVAAFVILAASAILGSLIAGTEAPRQQTPFERNFAPIVIVPAEPPAPVAKPEAPLQTAPPPIQAEASRSSEI